MNAGAGSEPPWAGYIAVELPEYAVDREPDHGRLGRKVDAAICQHFTGHKIVARGISAEDHPGRTAQDLVRIIRTTGTDRYDPDRHGDRYDNVDGKRIDLFGMRRTVTARMRLFAALSWGFYHGSLEIHGHPTRLDLVTIYDATQLRAVLHRYEGRADHKRDGFRFVEPDRKAEAVLGIVGLGR